ncbi:MAG TPA: SusC/RagA family TonB-linked outer membrane protein [Gemmatimonadales bacterium]|nr:SusC/RagA family TonB-linked outer membrane protein [Gemmatimonadales bacterium]
MNTRRFRSSIAGIGVLAVVLAWPAAATAQQGRVEGRVTDQASGQPIAGARVVIVGTTLVTLTNAEGRYALVNVPAGQATVRVTAIGYGAASRTVTVAADAVTTEDVTLSWQPYSLDQVVVTATGDQAKKELGTSVATIQADSLVMTAPIANMADLLVTKAAGVQVLPGNITGAEARVRIRGTSSLSLSNEPIYYIDGIRMEAATGSSSIGIGGTNPSRVNDINPEEIESVEIVRGPSAATLYGTDAANGVIVIRTKRGRAGAAQWNVYSELGVIKDYNDWPIAYRGWRTGTTSSTNSLPTNAVQCLLTQVARAQCVQDSVTTFNLFEDPDASPLGTGWRGQVGAQVSGGSDALRYFLSSEYEEEIGVLRMPDFAYGRVLQTRGVTEVPYEQYRPNARERVSLRANLHASLSPKLDAAAFTSFISSNQRLPQTDNNTTGLLSNALGGPGHKDNVSGITGLPNYGYRLFTPDEFFSETVRQDINRFIGSGTITYRPTAWLSGRVVAGIDFTSRVDEDLCRRDECVAFSDFKEGFKEENRTTFHDYTLDANLSASYGLPQLFGAQARTTGGLQYIKNVFARNGAYGENFAPGASTITPAAELFADETYTASKTLGAFLEQQVSWNDRLYLTGAVRMDDNSAFGKDFSAVYYPKFSASWVVSQEPFFPAPSWLSNLRARMALGASGRQPGSTDALTFFAPTTAKFEGADRPALVFSLVGDPTLKPERATELEVGFDAAFLDSRVNLEFTYYNKVTKDALISRPLPPSAGLSGSRFENLGSLRNRGVEVVLNAIVVNTPALAWDVNLSGSHNRNTILELGVPPIVGTTIQQREGYPVDSYWQRPILGYNDVNGDGILEASEVVVGDTAVFFGPNVPEDELALSTGIELFNRRLRISGLFDYKGGRYQLNGTERIRCESRLNCDGLIDPKAPLWKQARVVALREHPARTQAGFIEPVDMLRFREFSVSYTLPDAWAAAMRSQRVSLTLAGRNLWHTTGYSGMDPETGYVAGGLQTDFQTQPPPTYWTLRLNASF